ncbi:MAG TPA: archaetidylserine decarboxylase [Bacilli bacterium]
MLTRYLLRLLTELTSRKRLSRAAGRFAKSKWSRRLIPRFIKIYGIAVDEAEKRLTEFVSLNDFFTRRLKPGARPIDSDPRSLISPVDGTVVATGTIADGQILQVKGQDYTVDELLNHSPRAINYQNGTFYILYLSPADYHRVHAPATGTIEESEHVPGSVYPVNEFGMRRMRKILSRNERLITYIRHQDCEIAVVKVGALNVSSIRYIDPLPEKITRGDELALFEFGSTVVLLVQSGTFRDLRAFGAGDKIKCGQALGLFL